MPVTLVRQAIEQSRVRDPVVSAMALLHGARVLAAVDWEGAKRTYAEGCAAVDAQTLDGNLRDLLPSEVVKLGASVDPTAALARFRRLPRGPYEFLHQSIGTDLVQELAQQGNFEAAVELLEDLSCPAGGAGFVIQLCPDVVLQRRAMAAGLARWRMLRRPGPPFSEHDFFHVFSHYWEKLEPAEQVRWLDEVLRSIETEPDSPTNARFGEVELHSTHDRRLFDILHIVRALKPAEEVEAILRAHPDVAKGAEIYPLGRESIMAKARAASTGQSCGTGGGIIMGGGTGDRPLMDAMMRAHGGDSSAVADMMAEALQRFREDKDPENPNRAPVPFWPSCRAYQTAMHWAGQMRGMDAAPLLAEIPDTDLAIFGAIELAAGVLGLPQSSGVQVGRSRRRR